MLWSLLWGSNVGWWDYILYLCCRWYFTLLNSCSFGDDFNNTINMVLCFGKQIYIVSTGSSSTSRITIVSFLFVDLLKDFPRLTSDGGCAWNINCQRVAMTLNSAHNWISEFFIETIACMELNFTSQFINNEPLGSCCNKGFLPLAFTLWNMWNQIAKRRFAWKQLKHLWQDWLPELVQFQLWFDLQLKHKRFMVRGAACAQPLNQSN